MGYDWSPHRDVLYDLYVVRRKPLDDIIKHMQETFAFSPSRRAFQTQFRRWEFPTKQNPAHRNADLVRRVQQLWERNLSQREMLETLNNEGYRLRERELMRLRAKFRLLLRVPNGGKDNNIEHRLLEAVSAESQEIERKREQRLDELKEQSDVLWATKKRRRRTRGFAGLAPDPGPPRFPSETTLDESKAYLNLDNEAYRRVREKFQTICEEAGVIKKTLAGEKWQDVKDRLVQDDTSLQQVFWDEATHQEAKALALDVVCLDVTKRMRTMDKTLTIAAAKNVLGINPEQSRQIRTSLYNILKADSFRSITEAGHERWMELKGIWLDRNPLLGQVLDPARPDHDARMKALDFIARDVVKRVRDDYRKGPNGKAPALSAQSQPLHQNHVIAAVADTRIDPSLLQAANGVDNSNATASPVAVYLKPHPRSQMYANAKMRLGTLATRTVEGLKELFRSKFADIMIMRIDGVERDSTGNEIIFMIEEDEELEAYLDHVQGRKAVFMALLSHI